MIRGHHAEDRLDHRDLTRLELMVLLHVPSHPLRHRTTSRWREGFTPERVEVLEPCHFFVFFALETFEITIDARLNTPIHDGVDQSTVDERLGEVGEVVGEDTPDVGGGLVTEVNATAVGRVGVHDVLQARGLLAFVFDVALSRRRDAFKKCPSKSELIVQEDVMDNRPTRSEQEVDAEK